jgi:uncharacterized protein (DUF1697 family)
MIYISLLRGINVGWNKRILMKDLVSLYANLWFENIQTYIQSGNAIFQSTESDRTIIIQDIETAIMETYGFEVRVILRTPEEMRSIVSNMPFKWMSIEYKYYHVCFLSEIPDANRISTFSDLDFWEDVYEIIWNTLYIAYNPITGAGKSKLTLSIIEKKLGIIGTSRNWNVVTELNNILSSYVHL